MVKKALLLLLLTYSFDVFAQTTDERGLIRQARRDVANFRLNKTNLKQFRMDKKNLNSDLFKPSKSMVSNTILLNDSVYTQAFRTYAYVKTRSRVNTGLYALVGGGILVLSFVYILTHLDFEFQTY